MTPTEAAEAMRESAALFVLNSQGAAGSVNLAEAIMTLPLPAMPEPPSRSHAAAQIAEGTRTLLALDAETKARECDQRGWADMAAWWRARPNSETPCP
jgi:hypothetical protein